MFILKQNMAKCYHYTVFSMISSINLLIVHKILWKAGCHTGHVLESMEQDHSECLKSMLLT